MLHSLSLSLSLSLSFSLIYYVSFSLFLFCTALFSRCLRLYFSLSFHVSCSLPLVRFIILTEVLSVSLLLLRLPKWSSNDLYSELFLFCWRTGEEGIFILICRRDFGFAIRPPTDSTPFRGSRLLKKTTTMLSANNI